MELDPEAYTYIVTWTYFSVYVLIFLIVSIVCAYEVKQKCNAQKAMLQESQLELPSDYNAKDWTTKGLFTQWYKLLWKEKSFL